MGGDAEDSLVIDAASLKSGIARHLINTRLAQTTNGKARGILAQNHLITEDQFQKLKENLGYIFWMIDDFAFRAQHMPKTHPKSTLKTHESNH